MRFIFLQLRTEPSHENLFPEGSIFHWYSFLFVYAPELTNNNPEFQKKVGHLGEIVKISQSARAVKIAVAF